MTRQEAFTMLDQMAKGIAEMFGSNCETVIHDLADPLHPVLAIYNGHVSGRSVGSTRDVTGVEQDLYLDKADADVLKGKRILIVDDVIPAVRQALRSKFARAKNTAQSRSAIRSQVIVELEKKVAEEIIDSYGEVTVTASEDDPTVCLVEFSFAVAHGLNQIYLTVHITV